MRISPSRPAPSLAAISLSLILVILATFPAAAQPVVEKQQEMLALFFAGDYDAGMNLAAAMAREFPDEHRGRTAAYHAGNNIENAKTTEAANVQELRAVLQEARQAYRDCADLTRDVKPAQTFQLAKEAQSRVEGKLGTLDRIERREIEFGEASELLGDMYASRAAAAWVKSDMDRVGKPTDRHYFYFLIHETSAIDDMSARLTGAYERFQTERPELYRFSHEKYVPIIAALTEEAIEIAQEAIAACPESPYWLDYHVHLASAHRDRGLLALARRDAALAEQKLDEAQSELSAARTDIERFREIHSTILEMIEARGEERVVAPGVAVQGEEALDRYLAQSRRHLQSAASLLQDLVVESQGSVVSQDVQNSEVHSPTTP